MMGSSFQLLKAGEAEDQIQHVCVTRNLLNGPRKSGIEGPRELGRPK